MQRVRARGSALQIRHLREWSVHFSRVRSKVYYRKRGDYRKSLVRRLHIALDRQKNTSVNVKVFSDMPCLVMFVTAVCLLFLFK